MRANADSVQGAAREAKTERLPPTLEMTGLALIARPIRFDRDTAGTLAGWSSGAIPKMRDDDACVRECRREFAETRHKKLIRQAVKPVAPNAGLSKPTRQGECLSKIRLPAMKSRVEAGYLGNLRRNVQDRANGGEIVRLMKRRQWREPGKVVQDIRCHPHGAIIEHTPVNDTVTERGNRLSSQEFGAHGDDLAHGGVMVKAFGREGAFLDDFALGVGDLQAWRTPIPPIWPRKKQISSLTAS